MSQSYFAVTTPGLEVPLLNEIRAIGGRKANIVFGGVEFEGTHAVFYRANYLLRTAQRVLLRVDEFRARDTPELYNKTKRYEWQRLMTPGRPIFVKASAHQSRLIHTEVIASVVFDGIRDHFAENKKGPGIKRAERLNAKSQLVMARLNDDRCTLSLDGSGDLLYRRGWRRKIGKAPLRETAAAALLNLAGWQVGEPLYDPMCGSGTFIIEAATMAAGIAPGKNRDFSLKTWANFKPDVWQKMATQSSADESAPEALFFGSDIDSKMIAVAHDNSTMAGVDSFCSFEQKDVAEMTPPCDQPGLIICNPPYGERLSFQESTSLDNILGQVQKNFSGWRLAMLIPVKMQLPKSALQFEELARFRNGGIPVKLMMAHVSSLPSQ